MDKISIIIPVYNAENYIRDCLQSVIEQTYNTLEIICIDDGSTDNSLKILHEYKKRDGRIQVIEYGENRGQSYARNRGLEIAKGKYVYFLDSDDYIEKNAMELLHIEAEKYGTDVIFFDAKLIYENDELESKYRNYQVRRRMEYKGTKSGVELFSEFVKNQEWSCSVPRQFWSCTFLKQNELKFYEGIIHEDELFSFQGVLLASKARFLGKQLFYRRFRENSTMTKKISGKNFYGWFTIYYYMNQFAFQMNLRNEAVSVYLARVYQKLQEHLEEMLLIPNFEEGFSTEELINTYRFFVATQEGYKAYGSISKKLLTEVTKYKGIYIYGAGVVGKSVYRGLIKKGVEIQGFLVSTLENNRTVMMGHPVIEISRLQRESKEVLVIVAANGNYREEIIDTLNDMGVTYVLYCDE